MFPYSVQQFHFQASNWKKERKRGREEEGKEIVFKDFCVREFKTEMLAKVW